MFQEQVNILLLRIDPCYGDFGQERRDALVELIHTVEILRGDLGSRSYILQVSVLLGHLCEPVQFG